MNEILKEYLTDLNWEVISTWKRICMEELNELNGDKRKLEKLLIERYGYSFWEARKHVAELLQRYDNLAFRGEWNLMKVKIQEYWTELSCEDLENIACSRSRLLEELQDKLGKSKEQAINELREFLRQFSN